MIKNCKGYVANSRTDECTLTVFIVDQDEDPCPGETARMFGPEVRCASDVLIAVASRELEAWFLADPEAIAAALAVQLRADGRRTDDVRDPKRHLFDVLRKQGRRSVSSADIAAKIAPGFSFERAVKHSTSLARLVKRAHDLCPELGS